VAQAPIPIYSQRETFYVPRFEVYVRGQKLKASVIDDILQVTYTDSINDIDSFQIEINNWDADRQKFKFAPPLKTPTVDYSGIFEPGSKIEVWMGYQDNMRRMLRGVITSLSPNYPESGASTLSVSGLNELHQYRTEQHTYSWLDGKKTDTDIAKDLCGRPQKKGQPGLGLKIDTNPSPDEKPDPIVFMSSEYDIVFLLERARRRGYELYLEDEGDTPKLFFGLSLNPGSPPVYRLEWGKSLISFRPTLSTAKQIGAVTVRGWDRKANKAIDETYTLEDLWKEQKKSQSEIARLSQIANDYRARTEVVTDKPAHTVKEARDMAKSILLKTDNRLIEATGSTVGLPDLHAGCSVEIVGFGVVSNKQEKTMGASSDFDGEYFITESTHTVGNGGYRTEFSARREGPVKVDLPSEQNS
jgi:Bacteriophage probable baseplate hub protein